MPLASGKDKVCIITTLNIGAQRCFYIVFCISGYLLKLVNGGSQLTVTSNSYDTQDEFERMKKLLLTLPRNEQGKPSEDYKQSKVNINGLPMTKTTNPLRIGHPDEEGEEMQQTVLLYFQENKRRVFAIVMLVADEKAQADLDAITSSIQIEK